MGKFLFIGLILLIVASLAIPVGAALAYEIFGWGWKPALKAIGTSARRRARSRARWKSRLELKRSRPRLV